MSPSYSIEESGGRIVTTQLTTSDQGMSSSRRRVTTIVRRNQAAVRLARSLPDLSDVRLSICTEVESLAQDTSALTQLIGLTLLMGGE